MRILCVDDDEDTCQLLTFLLGASGFEAVCVPDALTALRLMAGEQFILYILDGQLPGTSGLTLCQRIRQRDLKTPVLIFSGHGHESDRAAGMGAGANAYIVKPEINELVPTIKRLLAQAQV
jgi:two-component system, OmpR family, alkaline phosphatase synthesis response regulator PhoP